MAEIIDDYDFEGRRRRGGRPSAYPWDEWTDGQARRLTRSKDFTPKPRDFRVMAYKKATQLGMKASVAIEDDKTVVLQFRPAS